MEKIVITKDYEKHIRRFNTRARTVEFKIRPIPQDADHASWIRDAISEIVLKATEHLAPTDMVGFTFCSSSFELGQGWIRFQQASKVTVDDVWEVLSGIFQSNSSGLDTNSFCLEVTSVRLPIGRGRGKMYNTYAEECKKRRGIIEIKNKDNLCLPRALVVAIANATKDSEYNKIRVNQSFQKEKAMHLMRDAGIQLPEEGGGLPELQKFQDFLSPRYKITVYLYGTKGRDLVFKGPTGDGKHLNLLFHNGHYNVITSCTAAFASVYFCEDCHFGYDHKNRHRCSKSCSACQQSPPCENGIKVRCEECLRTFRSQSCFENHKNIAGSLGKTPICEQVRLCPSCLTTVRAQRQHTCGEIFCQICEKHQPKGHLCFIQKDKGQAKNMKDTLFVFYDLETRQEKLMEDGSYEHQPNICVYKQCCENCIHETNLLFCQKCGFRTKVITDNVISRFMDHLLQIRQKFKNVIVLAHNGQAFDHQFILNHILSKTDLTPEIILRGTKIILLQMGSVKFLDSLNYFPMALSELPKAFGLPDAFKKGYFPHLFNREENQNYEGPLPAVHYYSPDTMKVESRKKFLEWYAEHRTDTFNFQKEIVDYCVSDVEILTQACLKFQNQMITTTNVCPFAEAVTIASACNKVFRRNFLKTGTIGVIPKNGYRLCDIQSNIALKWLIFEKHRRNIEIQHAANGREAVVHGQKVDGICESSNQIFEFHGCYWHGCPSCFKYQRDDPLPDNPTETLTFRYESTLAKTKRLRSYGFEVIEKWECEFRNDMKENPDIELFTKNQQTVSKLNPRDAFYGGRTGNCKTYYKAKEGEKIKYLDVCSLYPWVCKYGKFPVGHPEIFVGKNCENLILLETDGLIKAKILPPQDLYHPVLPKKMNSKLMFVLCNKCGENMSYEECQHTEEDRALTGTWVIDEVLKAIEKGYKILEIYEIWKYQVEQYDMERKTGGLFAEMMNKFIKIKQEASGWPADCTGDEQKRKYVEDFFVQEGVSLEFGAILKNPGLRCLAKLMLNSFWGKLGQQENHPKTMIVNKPEVYFNLLTNPAMEVNSILPINDDVLVVNYEFKEESYDPLKTVNVCLAAYTTAQARLKLYSYLEVLEQRVLYYDTDSVIFSQKEGDFVPTTGDFIGDMTDELESYGSGSYIIEFVSGGPKNYAYKFYSTTEKEEKMVCKVKGICLNYNASQLVNFGSIKEMILKSGSSPIKITSTNIRRTKQHEVITREETKRYKPNSLKRKFFDDHSSEPYGFKKQK